MCQSIILAFGRRCWKRGVELPLPGISQASRPRSRVCSRALPCLAVSIECSFVIEKALVSLLDGEAFALPHIAKVGGATTRQLHAVVSQRRLLLPQFLSPTGLWSLITILRHHPCLIPPVVEHDKGQTVSGRPSPVPVTAVLSDLLSLPSPQIHVVTSILSPTVFHGPLNPVLLE